MSTSLANLGKRSQDVQTLLEAIAEQEATIQRLQQDRAEIDPQSLPLEYDDADQRVFNAHQYLRELRDELVSALETPIGPETAEPEVSGEEDETVPEGLAVVIGHSPRGDPGACGVAPLPAKIEDGGCEYFWNRELATWIREELTALGVRCEVFHRLKAGSTGILDTYRQVVKWRPQATVELHFNAFNGTAEGTETVFELPGSKAWAAKLQGGMVKLFGHEGKLSPKGAKLDRGLKLASANGRGTLNLTRISPSALTEPFFGDNSTDAARGVNNKRALAKTIAQAFVEFSGTTVSATPSTGTGATPVAKPNPVPPTLWDQLRETYSKAQIEFPHLKPITFAQWALESGFGTSELATKHLNFGGMKFREFLSDIAKPVDYKGDKYCKFRNLSDFIKGYWRRFDKISNYQGWREHTQTQESYLHFIAPIYAPPAENPNYIPKIMSIYERLKAKGELPALTASPQAPDNSVQVAGNLAALVAKVAPAGADEFVNLAGHYAGTTVPYPDLRLASVAQWALESNWGRSDLAKIHFNFGGMDWTDLLKDLAAPVDYTRGDGTVFKFCRFASLDNYIEAYWARFARDARFTDLPQHTGSAEAFVAYIGPVLRPGDANYAKNVLNIYARLQGAIATGPQTGSASSSSTGTAPATGPAQDGFVIHIQRTHTERRVNKPRHRTVGNYQVFFNGQKIDGLEGMCFETCGPGDNTSKGIRTQCRVEAKTYSLYTHHGSKTLPDANGRPKTAYVTHGYTSDERTRVPPMPSIRLGSTGFRSGVLFHPAEGYIWSIGCLHLSTPLNGPNSNINYKDSRARVIAVIDAMKAALGTAFPNANNKLIPNTKVVIEGEPLPGGKRDIDFMEFEVEAETEEADPNLMSDEDAYDLISATMNAKTSVQQISYARYQRLVNQRSDVLSLRGDAGQNLWFEWAGGWEASFTLADTVAEALVQTDLRKIADELKQAGLNINDEAGLLTPLTAAAAFNEWHAVKALHERGANLNQRNRQGNTPLAAAGFQGAVETVEFLLSAGADRSAKTAGITQVQDSESDDFDGPVDTPLWTQEYAETCPPAATPLECAEAGREFSKGDPERESAYDKIIAMLRQAG